MSGSNAKANRSSTRFQSLVLGADDSLGDTVKSRREVTKEFRIGEVTMSKPVGFRAGGIDYGNAVNERDLGKL